MDSNDLLPQVRDAARASLAPVDGLVAEARREAEERVRGVLVEAFTEALLERVAGELKTSDLAPALTRQAEPEWVPARSHDLGIYVYCVMSAHAAEKALPKHGAGIDPAHGLRLVVQGDLAAMISKVSLEEFGEEELRANLADVQWLASAARAHEVVIEAVSDETTVVPMRLCTIMRSVTDVRDMLLRERSELSDALDYLAHRSEWAVKVYVLEQAQDGELRRLKARQDLCASIHEQLTRVAVDSYASPLQVSARDEEMLLNGIYLVDDDQLPVFLELVDVLADELREQGLAVEPGGPSPAYNFAPGAIGAIW